MSHAIALSVRLTAPVLSIEPLRLIVVYGCALVSIFAGVRLAS